MKKNKILKEEVDKIESSFKAGTFIKIPIAKDIQFFELDKNETDNIKNSRYLMSENVKGKRFSVLISQFDIEFTDFSKKIQLDELNENEQLVFSEYLEDFNKIQEIVRKYNLVQFNLMLELANDQLYVASIFTNGRKNSPNGTIQILLISNVEKLTFLPFVHEFTSLEFALSYLPTENNDIKSVLIQPLEKTFIINDNFFVVKKEF